MSKYIKMTPECLEEVRKEFNEALSGGKFADGKISFTKTIGSVERKATVFFTELAWMKMQTLIREFDKEVAWHGVATRGDDASKDEYYISDILVYPQEVTGATVNTNQVKYQTWLMNHDDDVFNNIRMQGHSHVNMGTTPSGVDTSLYERILEQLDDDMFYIFMIWNKKKEKTIKIYDLAKNTLFETSDVTVEVLDDGTGVEKFIKDAKNMVEDKPTTYSSTPSYKGTGGYSGYSGYGGYYGGYGSSYGNTQQKTETKPTSANNTSSFPSVKQGSGKKKGKRKGKNKNNRGGVNNACDEHSQLTLFSSQYDDDWDDDMKDPFYSRGW